MFSNSWRWWKHLVDDMADCWPNQIDVWNESKIFFLLKFKFTEFYRPVQTVKTDIYTWLPTKSDQIEETLSTRRSFLERERKLSEAEMKKVFCDICQGVSLVIITETQI